MTEEIAFTNELKTTRSLPDTANLEFEKLPISHWHSQLAVWSVVFLAIIGINLGVNILSGNIDEWPTNILGVPVLEFGLVATAIVYALGAVVMRASHEKKGFCLRDHDIHYQTGLLWQVTKSLPYTRVQHVELETGPIERLFGLTSLKFFSAGGSGADITIPGLKEAMAQKTRDFVMAKAKDLTPQLADKKD